MTRLTRRIQQLEQAMTPPASSAMWLVCRHANETEAQALARQRVMPRPHDLVVLMTYYGPLDTHVCPQCAHATEAPMIGGPDAAG
jgi:hypothetical protein